MNDDESAREDERQDDHGMCSEIGDASAEEDILMLRTGRSNRYGRKQVFHWKPSEYLAR